VVSLHKLADDGKPDAGATAAARAAGVGAEESFEDVRQSRRIDGHALVGHRHSDSIAGIGDRRHHR